MAANTDEAVGHAGTPAASACPGTPEFARLSRALLALSAGTRALLRASDEGEPAGHVQGIAEVGGYCLACVANSRYDPEQSLRWMAGVGFEAAAFDAAGFTWADNSSGQGALGTTIRTRKPIIGRHLLTDPLYQAPM